MSRLLAALAAVILGFALQLSEGQFDLTPLKEIGLAMIAIAGVLALASARLAFRAREPADAAREARLRRLGVLALGGGCAGSLLGTLLGRPVIFLSNPQLAPLRVLALAALLILSAYLCAHLRPAFARARFALLLVLAFALGAAVIQRSPQPWIDVWYFQQMGADALLGGRNPYAATYPNLYSMFYDPSLLRDGGVHGTPYPPLSLLLAVPARVLFGDIRFLHLCALIGCALLLARLGREAGDPEAGELAGLFVALQPRALLVIELAWTDVTVLFFVLLAALAALRWWKEDGERPGPRPLAGAWVCGVALGLALSIKQYAPLVLLPLFAALPRRGWLRAAASAALVAAALALPLLIWDPYEFYFSVVRMQLVTPLRLDALSFVALAARATPLPRAAAAVGFAAAFGLVAAFWPRPGRFHAALATSSAAFLWFLLFNKQAFCNYYFLAVGLLCAAWTLPTKLLATAPPPR